MTRNVLGHLERVQALLFAGEPASVALLRRQQAELQEMLGEVERIVAL